MSTKSMLHGAIRELARDRKGYYEKVVNLDAHIKHLENRYHGQLKTNDDRIHQLSTTASSIAAGVITGIAFGPHIGIIASQVPKAKDNDRLLRNKSSQIQSRDNRRKYVGAIDSLFEREQQLMEYMENKDENPIVHKALRNELDITPGQLYKLVSTKEFTPEMMIVSAYLGNTNAFLPLASRMRRAKENGDRNKIDKLAKEFKRCHDESIDIISGKVVVNGKTKKEGTVKKVAVFFKNILDKNLAPAPKQSPYQQPQPNQTYIQPYYQEPPLYSTNQDNRPYYPNQQTQNHQDHIGRGRK